MVDTLNQVSLSQILPIHRSQLEKPASAPSLPALEKPTHQGRSDGDYGDLKEVVLSKVRMADKHDIGSRLMKCQGRIESMKNRTRLDSRFEYRRAVLRSAHIVDHNQSKSNNLNNQSLDSISQHNQREMMRTGTERLVAVAKALANHQHPDALATLLQATEQGRLKRKRSALHSHFFGRIEFPK